MASEPERIAGVADTTSHDQNFKNLIVDYPRDALAFFAAEEAPAAEDDVEITPLRQEQLKDRLGDRFRELDVPLLVEWRDGRREAVLFVVEEETEPRRFSPHRLAHYCLDLARMFDTDRVVPVAIFLRDASAVSASLVLGTELRTYLKFDYLACRLAEKRYEDWRDSDNVAALVNLPNMRVPAEHRVDAYAAAVRGLLEVETDGDRRQNTWSSSTHTLASKTRSTALRKGPRGGENRHGRSHPEGARGRYRAGHRAGCPEGRAGRSGTAAQAPVRASARRRRRQAGVRHRGRLGDMDGQRPRRQDARRRIRVGELARSNERVGSSLRELLVSALGLRRLQHRDGDGGRALVQRTLRGHIREATGATFDTPFFIRPAASRRALWLIHLSRHPTARDVMMQCHWQIKNTFEHYGPGDFGMLGWDVVREPTTLPLFNFAELDAERMKDGLLDAMVHELSELASVAPASIEDVRKALANRTAARFADLDDVILQLAREKEFDILSRHGKTRLRNLKHLQATDRVSFPKTPLLPFLSRNRRR